MRGLPSGRTISDDNYVFRQNYGIATAPGVTGTHRWIARGMIAASSTRNGWFMIAAAGRFNFKLSWQLFGTPLAVDDCRIDVFRTLPGGANFDSGMRGNIPAGVVGASGEVSLDFTVTFGEGLIVGLVQSGTEANSAWNLAAYLRAQ